MEEDEEVIVLSPDHIVNILNKGSNQEIGTLIDPSLWLNSDYSPLPSLIQAARMLWDDKTQLPKIRRAESAGIQNTINELILIARKAKDNNELHLALVTGVPGSGKTLVGIQLVYENKLDVSESGIMQCSYQVMDHSLRFSSMH